MSSQEDARRRLPSMDTLLQHPAAGPLLAVRSRSFVVAILRESLAEVRNRLFERPNEILPSAEMIVADAILRASRAERPGYEKVVNATGVVLHTNLGRATLCERAVARIAAVAAEPCALEFDSVSGTRGDRDEPVGKLIRTLTGAPAATVVNNNAAAVLLAVNTLAANHEVVVSRGELIEIGGSFRIPEVLTSAGARLHEVGTTNRTHPADYEQAIGPESALLLKVHTSNYRMVGFTADVDLASLVSIGRRHSIPVMEDLGSGALVDLSPYGLPKEPVVRERLAAGAEVVTFSSDKLLGGPQAGIICGSAELIARMNRNPLKRALRCDKMTLAALEATLQLYASSADLETELPTLRFLTRSLEDMDLVGTEAKVLLREALGDDYTIDLVRTDSEIGSGSQPSATLPSLGLAITHTHCGPLEIAARFRGACPSVVGRVHDERFLLDLRCILNPADLVPRPAS